MERKRLNDNDALRMNGTRDGGVVPAGVDWTFDGLPGFWYANVVPAGAFATPAVHVAAAAGVPQRCLRTTGLLCRCPRHSSISLLP
jgi:hypothetical protein